MACLSHHTALWLPELWTSDPTFLITNIAPLTPSSLSAKQSSVMELLLSRAWPTTCQPPTRIGWSTKGKTMQNVRQIAGHGDQCYDFCDTSVYSVVNSLACSKLLFAIEFKFLAETCMPVFGVFQFLVHCVCCIWDSFHPFDLFRTYM